MADAHRMGNTALFSDVLYTDFSGCICRNRCGADDCAGDPGLADGGPESGYEVLNCIRYCSAHVYDAEQGINCLFFPGILPCGVSGIKYHGDRHICMYCGCDLKRFEV